MIRLKFEMGHERPNEAVGNRVRFAPEADISLRRTKLGFVVIKPAHAVGISGRLRIGPGDGYRARNVGTRVIASARAAEFVPV
jgi:hypothetical protein